MTETIKNKLLRHSMNFVFKPDDHISMYNIHRPKGTCFFDIIRNLRLVKNTYTTDQLPDDIFIYEYQQTWEIEPTEFFGENGFFEMDPCPELVLNRVREKTAFIVISMPYESPLQPHRLESIHRYFKKHDLPSSQVIYFTCCLNGNELYVNYCNSINDSPRCTIEYGFENLSINSTLANNMEDIPYVPKIRKKTFLTFNRRWHNHPHRTLLLYHIYKMNMIDDFYISFNKTDVDHPHTIYSDRIKNHYAHFFTRDNMPSIDLDMVMMLEDALPYYLDTNDLVTTNLMFDKFDTTKQFYDDSFINIISETYFYTNTNDILHLTEKTFKPILYKQPFIMVGPPNMLRKIRELGFKTFNSVWDESYDETLNHTDRFFKIIELCDKIRKWPNIKKVMAMKQCKYIIDYNFNLLKDFNKSKKSLIELIEKHGLSPY